MLISPSSFQTFRSNGARPEGKIGVRLCTTTPTATQRHKKNQEQTAGGLTPSPAPELDGRNGEGGRDREWVGWQPVRTLTDLSCVPAPRARWRSATRPGESASTICERTGGKWETNTQVLYCSATKSSILLRIGLFPARCFFDRFRALARTRKKNSEKEQKANVTSIIPQKAAENKRTSTGSSTQQQQQQHSHAEHPSTKGSRVPGRGGVRSPDATFPRSPSSLVFLRVGQTSVKDVQDETADQATGVGSHRAITFRGDKRRYRVYFALRQGLLG